MTDRKLLVSAGPHVRGGASTTSVMGDVLIALLPAVVASVLVFGTRALLLEVVCVAASILFEYLFRKITKRSNTISDLSAAVTGLLLAMNLPASFPIWMAVVGCFVAIVVVKQALWRHRLQFRQSRHHRPYLPAHRLCRADDHLADRQFLHSRHRCRFRRDPLALIKEGAVDSLPAVKNLLFGIRGGCLGETCAIALIIGFVYLVVRRVITPTIPLVYVATIALMSIVLGYDPIYMILTGGVLLGGIFMLTDYSTSPATEWGKVVFALGAGIITMLIRNSSGGYPEGVSFAILLMNIICPHLNKIGAKKPFGVGGAEK